MNNHCFLQIDVAFQEVDVLDTSDLSFTMGCASEPAQPNIMRARLAMNDALQCVALVDSETKVHTFILQARLQPVYVQMKYILILFS